MHFFLNNSCCLPDRRAFPTRRSSDLELERPPWGTLLRIHHAKLRPSTSTRTCGARTGTCSIEWQFVDCPDCLAMRPDRKSTRLNSSHLVISYAVFCLKKNTISLLHAK